MWKSHYLRSLPPWQGSSVKNELRVGSVILVGDDKSTRLQWPMGVVTKVFPSTDGKVRSVEIKTAKGFLIRSIQRIFDLEVNSNGSGKDQPIQDQPITAKPEVKVTRFGRRVKKPERLDL